MMSDEVIAVDHAGPPMVATLPDGTVTMFRRITRHFQPMIHGIGYIKARLMERSTYVFIGGAIAGASALPRPWSYASMAVGLIAAMVPNGNTHGDS